MNMAKSVTKNSSAKKAAGNDGGYWDVNAKPGSLEGKFVQYSAGLPELVRYARKGVKTSVFYTFANLIHMPDKYLAELINISPRTLSNYKEDDRPLEPVKGEHLLKLIVLFKKGEDVFSDLHEFREWLQKPLSHLKDKPVKWLVTPGGVDLISQEVDRIAYGYSL